eukprot:2332774-Amphidinium_carterae.1
MKLVLESMPSNLVTVSWERSSFASLCGMKFLFKRKTINKGKKPQSANPRTPQIPRNTKKDGIFPFLKRVDNIPRELPSHRFQLPAGQNYF